MWSDSSKFYEYSHLNYADTLTIDNRNQDNWYDSKWKYRRQIKFNNLENGELSHFPILVKLVHKDNFNYDKVHSQGNDIRFTDSDGTTIIPHDIEKWEETGTSYVWVKVPNIKASSNDDYIYMYYGNPEAIDTRNPTGVFDGKFALVHHFNQTPQNNETFSDSTNTNISSTLVDPNSRTKSGTEGKIGLGLLSQGPLAGSYIDLGDNAATDFSTDVDFTLEAWVNVTGSSTTVHRIFEKRSPTGYNFHYNSGNKALRVIIGPNSGACAVDGLTNINNMGWVHIAAVVYRRASCTSNDVLIYINGKREGNALAGGSTNTNTDLDISTPLYLFRQTTTSTGSFTGTIDEARISRTARDPSWIKASYETVIGDFQTYGSEETLGGELLSSIFDAGHGNNWGYLSYDADEPDKTAAKVKVRTGNNMYLSDASDFETCDSIINKSDISSNKCVTDGHRYIQYQVVLDTTEAAKTPVFESISITDFLPAGSDPAVKGVSTVASPSPLPSVIYNLESPRAGPRPSPFPSPSLNPKPNWLNPIVGLFEALFH